MRDAEIDRAVLEPIVRSIEAGKDEITVPADLLEEKDPKAAPTEPPKSLYTQILAMGAQEKIKLALRGNRDARMILIRDGAKLIRRFVLQNPRISDTEVIAVARNRSSDEELIRMIAEKREWIRNSQVRLALVTNPKTPLDIALRQVQGLGERDLRQLAKSKNVSNTIAVQARRMLASMGRPSE
jgi:hypothetical protein